MTVVTVPLVPSAESVAILRARKLNLIERERRTHERIANEVEDGGLNPAWCSVSCVCRKCLDMDAVIQWLNFGGFPRLFAAERLD